MTIITTINIIMRMMMIIIVVTMTIYVGVPIKDHANDDHTVTNVTIRRETLQPPLPPPPSWSMISTVTTTNPPQYDMTLFQDDDDNNYHNDRWDNHHHVPQQQRHQQQRRRRQQKQQPPPPEQPDGRQQQHGRNNDNNTNQIIDDRHHQNPLYTYLQQQHQRERRQRGDDQQTQQSQQSQKPKRGSNKRSLLPRILIGIFSCDCENEYEYRMMHRQLIQLYGNRICSLYDYQNRKYHHHHDNDNDEECSLVYTFVLGIMTTDDTTIGDRSQIVYTNGTRYHPIPLLTSTIPMSNVAATDFHYHDMTFLNIRENMNQGKSQTWFYYSTIIMNEMKHHSNDTAATNSTTTGNSNTKKYDYYRNNWNIDYVMKTDTDTRIYYDRFFTFRNVSLPPYPYNRHILVGKVNDKSATWPNEYYQEEFFIHHYQKLHLYTEGQMYMMSSDLVYRMTEYISSHRTMAERYTVGIEDHDVSTYAFLSLEDDDDENDVPIMDHHPITLMIVAKNDGGAFWSHPHKIERDKPDGRLVWQKKWDDEIARIQKTMTTTIAPILPPPEPPPPRRAAAAATTSSGSNSSSSNNNSSTGDRSHNNHTSTTNLNRPNLLYTFFHERQQQQQPQHHHKEQQQQQQQQQHHKEQRRHHRFIQKPRILMGIFSSDDDGRQYEYRMMHRQLIQSYDHRICSLHDYQMKYNHTNHHNHSNNIGNDNEECSLVYTFVLGIVPSSHEDDTNRRDQIVFTMGTRYHPIPIITETIPITRHHNNKNNRSDFHYTDMTFLNIRENTNQGKSQTWFYYSSIIMNEMNDDNSHHHNIHYVMKTDTETMIYYDRLLTFMNVSLPPYPYNRHILVGRVNDKSATWPSGYPQEEFFIHHYHKLHVYTEGQMYIVSSDLIYRMIYYITVHRNMAEQYTVGIADHDICTYLFLSIVDIPDHPITLMIIPKTDPEKFWLHPITYEYDKSQLYQQWKKIWDDEIVRVRTALQDPAVAITTNRSVSVVDKKQLA